MRFRLTTTLILVLFSTVMQAQQIFKTKSALIHARIYSKGATLEHKADINIPVGHSEIVISGVANQLDERSIQIGVPSSANILSVRFFNEVLDYPDAQNVDSGFAALRAAEEQLTEWNNKAIAERSTLNLIEKYADNLSSGSRDVNTEELQKLVLYYKKQQVELRNNLAAIETQKQQLETEVQALKIKAGLINAGSRGTARIVIKLMAGQRINSSISLSYFTPNAFWIPSYDFRVKDVNLPLNIVQKAEIVQTTGLDWQKVKLSLSTGNPTLGGTAPELDVWNLRYGNLEQVYGHINARTVSSAINGAAPGLLVAKEEGQPSNKTDIMLRGQGSLSASSQPLIVLDGAPYSGSLSSITPSDIRAITVLKDATSKSVYGARAANGVVLVSTVKQKNTGIRDYTSMEEHLAFATFDITIPYDIPSDGQKQTVAINDMDKKVTYEYLAIPKLDTDAFLMASLTDFESLNLQKGVANIIYDNNYIGQSFINPHLVQDTLLLSLGRDKRIITKRTKVADKISNKLIGGSKKRSFTYEILVKNTKSEAVNITVKENIPVAGDNSMSVELLEHSNAEYDEARGMLEWKLQLKPGATQSIRLSYSVKYQGSQWISNL